MTAPSERHPSTQHLMKFLEPNVNLKKSQKDIADYFNEFAGDLLAHIQQDSPELTAGLRKLLEAKDCFVRASLDENPVDYRDR